MPESLPLARVFAFLGGVAVVASTAVPWYDYEVLIDTPRVPFLFEVPVNLWNLYPLAAAVLVVGAVVATALLVVTAAAGVRASGIAALLVSAGLAIYAGIRAFDTPDLGIGASARTHVEAQTYVDAGPFVAFAGAMLLLVGALVTVLALAGEPRAERPPRVPSSGAVPPRPV